MPRASDVLAYIDFVWGLQRRETERLDPRIEWQGDTSWSQEMARTGWEGRNLISAMTLEPGDLTGSEEINTQLYWPGPPPVLSDRPRSFSVASSASQSSLRGAGLA